VIVEPGDRIDQVQFYIDGTLYDPPGSNQQDISTSGSGAGSLNSWYIGSSGNVDNTNWLGEIDGIRMYAVALSKTELDAIRLDGREGVGYYRWIREYYPGETNPTVIGFEADPDQDGIPNGLEYTLGKGVNVPNAADVLPEPQASVQGDAFVYSFERPDGAEGEDVTVVVESGPDLVTWPERYVVGKDAVDSDPQVRIVENANGRDQVEVWFPLQTMLQRFVRLWVDG
jgi:hypothetical protein